MTVKSLRTPWRSEILSNRADSFFYSSEKWKEEIDKNMVAVFLDLKRAFETIDRDFVSKIVLLRYKGN
jgi:hypothetical protein